MARVLYVEDNENMAEIIMDYLKDFGYEVIHFLNLNDAKIAFGKDEEQFDFIVSDGNLQLEGDGIQWAQELYEKRVRVLLIALDVDPKKVFPVPFIDKLNFDYSVLKTAIEELFNSKSCSSDLTKID